MTNELLKRVKLLINKVIIQGPKSVVLRLCNLRL